MGDERVLHRDGREDAAEQDEGRVELRAAHERLAAAEETGGEHRHSCQRGHEAEQDAGVAERAVHREMRGPVG